MPPTDDVISALTAAGRPLAGAGDDYDYFLELIGDARLVLLVKPRMALMSFIVSERRSRNV
jgi:hypothetical protein